LFGRVSAANDGGVGVRSQRRRDGACRSHRTGTDRASQQAVEPALAGCIERYCRCGIVCPAASKRTAPSLKRTGAALASGRHEIATQCLANGKADRELVPPSSRSSDFASDHDRAGVLGQDLCGDLENEQRQCRPGQLTRGAGPFRRQQLASRSGALPRPAGRGGHFQNR
jgi:hypothetical protein